MQLPEQKTNLEGRRSVNDPCVGSGRMLLAAAEIQPNSHFVGQDVDLRCVRMTAIKLAIRNHYGHAIHAIHAIHGNTLTNTLTNTHQHLPTPANTCQHIYETGRVQIYGNAIRKVNRVPRPRHDTDSVDAEECHHEIPELQKEWSENDEDDNQGPTPQLQLF